MTRSFGLSQCLVLEGSSVSLRPHGSVSARRSCARVWGLLLASCHFCGVWGLRQGQAHSSQREASWNNHGRRRSKRIVLWAGLSTIRSRGSLKAGKESRWRRWLRPLVPELRTLCQLVLHWHRDLCPNRWPQCWHSSCPCQCWCEVDQRCLELAEHWCDATGSHPRCCGRSLHRQCGRGWLGLGGQGLAHCPGARRFGSPGKSILGLGNLLTDSDAHWPSAPFRLGFACYPCLWTRYCHWHHSGLLKCWGDCTSSEQCHAAGSLGFGESLSSCHILAIPSNGPRVGRPSLQHLQRPSCLLAAIRSAVFLGQPRATSFTLAKLPNQFNEVQWRLMTNEVEWSLLKNFNMICSTDYWTPLVYIIGQYLE